MTQIGFLCLYGYGFSHKTQGRYYDLEPILHLHAAHKYVEYHFGLACSASLICNIIPSSNLFSPWEFVRYSTDHETQRGDGPCLLGMCTLGKLGLPSSHIEIFTEILYQAYRRPLALHVGPQTHTITHIFIQYPLVLL